MIKKRKSIPEELKIMDGVSSRLLSKITSTRHWENTSSGCFLKAGSNRCLQYLWNANVNTGNTTSKGVELAASLVLSNPISRS